MTNIKRTKQCRHDWDYVSRDANDRWVYWCNRCGSLKISANLKRKCEDGERLEYRTPEIRRQK